MSQKGVIINTNAGGHVDSSDFAIMNDSFIGGSGIMDYANKLNLTKVNNNTVRLADGVYILKGRAINVENYIELNVESGTLGMQRYDCVVAEYIKDGIEEGTDILRIRVLKGVPAASNAQRPILENNANIYQELISELFINGVELTIQISKQRMLPNLSSIIDMIYPVGIVVEFTKNIDPSTVVGGTWSRFGNGRVTVGVNVSETEFNTVKKVGGSKTHKLTVDQMPSHKHQQTLGGSISTATNSPGTYVIGNLNVSDVTATGGNAEHNNLQPYITVYRWERIA